MKLQSNIPILMGIIMMSMSLILSIVMGYILLVSEFMVDWEIFSLESVGIHLIFIFDMYSIFFLSLVLMISGSVLIFSLYYMSEEIFPSRFFFLLILFISSMVLLILSPNLMSLLLGWDGLGVTSYLLVIYYQSNKSYNAGMLTALTNRIGDVGILFSLGMMFYMGTWEMVSLSMNSKGLDLLIMFIIVISAMTKSAQIPFSAWLPAAMAAPTPVSALVHSSTLVTAGVYLLIRFYNLFASSKMVYFLMLMGIFTSLMAGGSAMFEWDMKKVIALSTLSQLGVMMMTLGLSMPLLAYFHLLSHAYFKAMMFMCAGILIHSIKSYQDIRFLAGGGMQLPVTMSIMTSANMSLCGLPFLSGFYSKDLILEMMLQNNISIFIYILIILATCLTLSYSYRVMVFMGGMAVFSTPFDKVQEDKFSLVGPLLLLPHALLGGLSLNYQLYLNSSMVFLPGWMKVSIPLALMISLIFMETKKEMNTFLSEKKNFFKSMWLLPFTYSVFFSKSLLTLGNYSNKSSEISWSEFLLFKVKAFKLGQKVFYQNMFIFGYLMNINIIFLVMILLYF